MYVNLIIQVGVEEVGVVSLVDLKFRDKMMSKYMAFQIQHCLYLLLINTRGIDARVNAAAVPPSSSS